MSSPDRPRVRGAQDPKPEDTLEQGKKKNDRPARGDGEKKPVFRFAKLDGRDTLKYEDTADK